MKVLIHSHSFLPHVGGVEQYTERLARYLAEEGVEATVVTESAAPGGYDSGRPYRVVRRPTVQELDRLVAQSDLLHCNGFQLQSFRLARKHNVPVLWFHHDYDVICPKSIAWNGAPCHFSPLQCAACLARDNPGQAVARRIASFAVKRACLNWAQVHATHTAYAKERMGLAQAVTLRCAADITHHSSLITHHPAPRTGHRSGFLFAGRLIPEKGCDVLLRALARCRDLGLTAPLAVCGDGREMPALQDLARDLGIHQQVRFLGNVSQDRLAGLMDGAAATVVPSVWDEVTGAVALEAMGRGCPVIASDVGGLGEMVRGVGLLFPRGDVESLAGQMAQVAGDEDATTTLSSRSSAAATQIYNWRLVIQEYLHVYGAVVGS